MDGETFDGIAKLVATTSRRRALRLAAGGLLGALFGRPDVVAARCFAVGKACKGNAQCCSKRCLKKGPCTKNGKLTGNCRCRCPEGRAPCGATCCAAGEVCTDGACQPGEPPGCRFEAECGQSSSTIFSTCCPGPDGLDFCYLSEDSDACPEQCHGDGRECPCREDADCPAVDNGEGSPESAFCCKNCAYRGDPEFGTCMPQSGSLHCARCGQTPTPCGTEGNACFPDEACCLNGDGSAGICCGSAGACSVSPTTGKPCCNPHPGCRGVGEYREEGTQCCCGISDSTSSGGGQVCCTRDIGQSCSSTAECCPDWSGDTVCRNGTCVKPPLGTSDADCPPERPVWCPPALVDGQMRPGYCANLQTSSYNCGACRNQCIVGSHCENGFCFH